MVIVGESEVEKGVISIKTLNDGIQIEVERTQLISKIEELVKQHPILIPQEGVIEAKE